MPEMCGTQAYWSGHYALAKVGEHFGVSYATVSRTGKQVKIERGGMSNVRPHPEIFRKEMVAHGLGQAKQYALLKQHGYSVNVSLE